MAVGLPAYPVLTQRYRRQASSHIKLCCLAKPVLQTSPPVGAGLPAMAVGQPAYPVLTQRYRRQASSHIKLCGLAKPVL